MKKGGHGTAQRGAGDTQAPPWHLERAQPLEQLGGHAEAAAAAAHEQLTQTAHAHGQRTEPLVAAQRLNWARHRASSLST